MKPPIHTLQAGYFPNALTELARYIQYGNAKHNPGQPLHWAFHKSPQHAESAARHLRDVGTADIESGHDHAAGLCWRALALLETQLINAGATPGFAVGFEKDEPVTINPTTPFEVVYEDDRLAPGYDEVQDPDGFYVHRSTQ